MDTVLGLSITSSALGLVLVEGARADGDIIDRAAIEVPADGTATATRAADQIAAAVARTTQIDAEHRLHSIGMTWSDDAGTEASLLLEALAEAGFETVAPVRLPRASEAFADGIGVVLGYSRTAVCVVQRDQAIASMVDSRYAEMRASSCDQVDHHSLLEWLTDLLAPTSWQPEALVMVGTGMDLAAVSADLETALDIPVFAPAEAELALARGAALAAVTHQDVALADLDDYTWESADVAPRTRQRGVVLGMSALAAGAVTLVASLAVAAGMQLTPDREIEATANRTVADAQPAAAPVAAPAQELPEVAPAAPVVPEAVSDIPVPEVLPEPVVVPEEPVYVPEEVVDVPVVEVPEPVYVPEPVAVPPAPVVVAQPPVVAQVPPVQEDDSPGFLGRLRDRIAAIGQPDPVQVAPVPVQQVPPPGVVPPP